MTPYEVNTWALSLIVGIPVLVVLGGGLILHMAVALACIALFFSHPVLAIILGSLWAFPWRWVFIGFGVGEGLKWSGVFNQRRRPHYPRRRPWTRAALRRHDDEYDRGPRNLTDEDKTFIDCFIKQRRPDL